MKVSRLWQNACVARMACAAFGHRAFDFIGMSERGAKACALANRWGFRVGERDGEQLAVTMDYRPDRVTVSVKADRVTAITVG